MPALAAVAQLSCFRGEFYSCLTARSDALFELADAVLCGDGPVRSPAELSPVGEHRRSDGELYAAVARGRIDAGRLRRALAEMPPPRAAGGRLVLAVDATCRLRPDADTSPDLAFGLVRGHLKKICSRRLGRGEGRRQTLFIQRWLLFRREPSPSSMAGQVFPRASGVRTRLEVTVSR